jgi:cold shock CspA family protein
VVARDQQDNLTHADVLIAIADAFDRVERQLQDWTRRQRGEVKSHLGPATGRVAKMFPDEGFGFIETDDLRDIYFHRNAVLDGGYTQLSVGDSVRFVEEMGAKGPQASTVSVVQKG